MMLDDGALLARIAAGDAEALRLLHERYHPRLQRYLWQRLRGDAHLVEDVLQEVFLRVWRHAGTFRGDAKAATWLFQIAHHQVMHLRRDLQRRAEGHLSVPLLTNDEDPTLSELSSVASPEEAVVDRLMLVAALEQLSPKHQEVLELIFQHGFSPDEVARILAIPLGTVKSRISYARKALLQILLQSATEEARS